VLSLHNLPAIQLRHHDSSAELIVAEHVTTVGVAIDIGVFVIVRGRRAVDVLLAGKVHYPIGQIKAIGR